MKNELQQQIITQLSTQNHIFVLQRINGVSVIMVYSHLLWIVCCLCLNISSFGKLFHSFYLQLAVI